MTDVLNLSHFYSFVFYSWVFGRFFCSQGYCRCCSVAKLCPTFCDPKDCSPPSSSVNRILQARVLEYVVVIISFSKESSWIRDRTHIFCVRDLPHLLYHWQALWRLCQFSWVAQSYLTLCDLCSMPGLPVHHQLPEYTQTHVHWVSDAIQPSHPHLIL